MSAHAMEDVGEEVRVAFSGPLSYRDGRELGVLALALEEPWVRRVVLDMHAVEGVDHAAAGMLRFCADRARMRSVSLFLTGVRPPVQDRLGSDLHAEIAAYG
jgi:anti-anti-sigma regulatory factor